MSESNGTMAASWPALRVVTATLVVVAVALAFTLAYLFIDILLLVFIGIVLATALEPLIAWLQRRGLSRSTATAGTYVALGVFLFALTVTGLPVLLVQASSFFDSWPETYVQLRQRLLELPSGLVARWGNRLPETWQTNKVDELPTDASLATVANVVSHTWPLIVALMWTGGVVLLAFFWSLHRERTLRSLLFMVSTQRRTEIRELIDDMQDKLGAYLRGQGLVCLVVGAMTLVAYLVIGLPYALALAVAAGILEAVPFFGPVLGAAPALLVALSVDPSKALWVAGVAVVVQLIENYLLVPRIMGHAVGIHPLVTLLALAGFGALFGFAGVVLAIPMAALLQLVFERVVVYRDEPPVQAPARDAAAVLQFEARNLMQDVRSQVRQKTAASDHDQIEAEIEAIAQELDRSLSSPTANVPSEQEAIA